MMPNRGDEFHHFGWKPCLRRRPLAWPSLHREELVQLRLHLGDKPDTRRLRKPVGNAGVRPSWAIRYRLPGWFCDKPRRWPLRSGHVLVMDPSGHPPLKLWRGLLEYTQRST
jgi:hypothetical protein